MKITMVLHKEIIFMRYYFVFVILSAGALYSNAEKMYSNSSIKSMIVQEIMKKVSNLTLNSLSKVPTVKKETILNKIENKLRKSAKAMGPDGSKYVKFIMEEFKTKAFDKKPVKNVTHVIRKSINLRAKDKALASGVIDPETKQELIKDIAHKIQSLAQGFLKNSKSPEKKLEVFENIKKRILDSAKQKHMQLHNKHEELKAYSSLIAQGLDVSMRKLLGDDATARRMKPVEEFEEIQTQNTEDIKFKNDTKVHDEMSKKAMTVINIDEINKYKDLITQTLNDTSLDPHCDEIVEETCDKIQSFNKISCGEGKSIPIENLCNGVIDCWNEVDEKNCTAQAMENVRKANAVMTEIEASLNRKCFAATVDGNVLTMQNQILRDVLQTQMEFLQKHVAAPLEATQNKNEITDEIFIKRTVNDVNTILSTLSYALDGTLCAHRVDPEQRGIRAARKFNDIEVDDLDDSPLNPSWSPKSCVCKGKFCDSDDCEAACKRICWQRYSLNHWVCQATNGGTSVTMNAICDGKLDCFDESDESNCASDTNFSKFEAGIMYSKLLDLLTLKSKSFEFENTRTKLLAMHGLVHQLQKHTVKTNTDAHTIRLLRDETFNLLVSIYDELLQTFDLDELDDAYLILLSINEKLVTALKRSHTGNENLISSDGCFCRNGLCALQRCTRNCIQTCTAEPLLTKFPCNTQNVTVPIESICNGRNNCPNGEDENGCNKEVCRGHHLVVLRHNLQNVAAKHRSSSLGEVIENWKTKVSAALFIAETTQRPNHKMMSHIIGGVLRDLVTAYASMEDYRKMHSEPALREFINISKIVMNTLKSCNN